MPQQAIPDSPGRSATVPDYETPEYRSYRRAVDDQNVSFHQVASAWFDWHWGPEYCDVCAGTGWLPAVTAAALPGDSAPPAPTNGSQEGEAAGESEIARPKAALVALAPSASGNGTTTRCLRCRGRGRIHPEESPGREAAYEEIFHELLEIFSKQRGGLITAYFCENIRVAAALTDIWSAADRADGPPLTVDEVEAANAKRASRTRRERFADWFFDLFRQKASSTAIHIEPTFGDPDSPRAKQILFRCLKVHYQALEYLKPKPRKICMRMTFNVITMLLGTLDNRIGRGEKASEFDQSHADQRTLEQELASTEAYYLTAAQRTTRLHYMLGMLIGLPLAGVTAYIVYRLPGLPTNMSVAFVAGSAGALVSVMERLTAGKLEMKPEAGRATNVTAGLIRPFIGALFAVALYFFISGGLVSVFNLPDKAVDQRYFFAGLGFLAGFSERFAQDMVAQGKSAAAVKNVSSSA